MPAPALVLVNDPHDHRCPNSWAIGTTRSNFSLRFQMMELRIALPWQYVSASSIAVGSVVQSSPALSPCESAFRKRRDVLLLIALRALQAHMRHMRASAHLSPRDLARLFPLSSPPDS